MGIRGCTESLMMSTKMKARSEGTRGGRICVEGRASITLKLMMKIRRSLNRKGEWLEEHLERSMRKMVMRINSEWLKRRAIILLSVNIMKKIQNCWTAQSLLKDQNLNHLLHSLQKLFNHLQENYNNSRIKSLKINNHREKMIKRKQQKPFQKRTSNMKMMIHNFRQPNRNC